MQKKTIVWLWWEIQANWKRRFVVAFDYAHVQGHTDVFLQ